MLVTHIKYLNNKEMITDEIVHQTQNRQLVEQIERSSSSSDNPARGIRPGIFLGVTMPKCIIKAKIGSK